MYELLKPLILSFPGLTLSSGTVLQENYQDSSLLF